MELLALVIFVAVIWASYAKRNTASNDESNQTSIYMEQMDEVAILMPGPVDAFLIRQSGHTYRDLGVFDTPSDAFVEVKKSFRRAKIEAVRVADNTRMQFKAYRLFFDHRGRKEGKKLGGVIIRSLT